MIEISINGANASIFVYIHRCMYKSQGDKLHCIYNIRTHVNTLCLVRLHSLSSKLPFATFERSSNKKTKEISSTAVLKDNVLSFHHNST